MNLCALDRETRIAKLSLHPKGKVKNDLDVTKFLLEKAHVAAVPGVTFGAEGYIRFVFAKSMEEIKAGMDRVEKSIHELN